MWIPLLHDLILNNGKGCIQFDGDENRTTGTYIFFTITSEFGQLIV